VTGWFALVLIVAVVIATAAIFAAAEAALQRGMLDYARPRAQARACGNRPKAP